MRRQAQAGWLLVYRHTSSWRCLTCKGPVTSRVQHNNCRVQCRLSATCTREPREPARRQRGVQQAGHRPCVGAVHHSGLRIAINLHACTVGPSAACSARTDGMQRNGTHQHICKETLVTLHEAAMHQARDAPDNIAGSGACSTRASCPALLSWRADTNHRSSFLGQKTVSPPHELRHTVCQGHCRSALARQEASCVREKGTMLSELNSGHS